MTNNEQGCLAEILFVAECLKLGIVPCKPVLDSNGYDFIVPKGGSFVKIQVKSTNKVRSGHSHYKISTHRDRDWETWHNTELKAFCYK